MPDWVANLWFGFVIWILVGLAIVEEIILPDLGKMRFLDYLLCVLVTPLVTFFVILFYIFKDILWGRFISKLFFWLTGGRPMQRVRQEFVDGVSLKSVHLFRDRRDGSFWLSDTAWWGLRIRPSISEEIKQKAE